MNLDGISSERDVPIRWSDTQNIAWKTPIPGKGHSSPITWNDRVFLTTAIEDQQLRRLLCLSRGDGHVIWDRSALSAPLEKKHTLNNYASATPCTDGQHVYVAFFQKPEVIVVCYDLDGNEIWRKSPGTFSSIHGWAAAPILYKDLLILNLDQDAPACVVALDKATGQERWRTDRPNRTRSYCVPLIIEAAGKTQMVLTGSKSVASYDPDTGQQYWVIDGPTEQYVASPVFASGVVFITAGFPTFHIMGIDPGGSGNVTHSHVLYHEETGAYVPSPLAVDDLIYMVSDRPGPDNGQVWCYEAKTGRRVWSDKLGKHHRPSPVYADGHLYFLDDDGNTFVLKTGRSFQLVAKNPLHEPCFASPVVSHGQIFIRTTENLYCIGKKQ